MHGLRRVFRVLLVPLVLAAWAAPAAATTFVRKGLDQLTVTNETIIQAQILEIHSYWNPDHTFILTDVRARPSLVLKGKEAGDVIFTLMGGSVGEVTVLVMGGADLAPGFEYVLFLSHSDLPGAVQRMTIPDHSQGAFRLEHGRAISQAAEEPLLPDVTGSPDVVGGPEGIDLNDFVREIRRHVNPGGEVGR